MFKLAFNALTLFATIACSALFAFVFAGCALQANAQGDSAIMWFSLFALIVTPLAPFAAHIALAD